ncbi:hypothetical protein [uncultured Croceitalea sp.]|uniref:hypothetical protein n=1 Tax=uncultured Croceitalea sp. TaxID=1798908 RepID=UPI003305A118
MKKTLVVLLLLPLSMFAQTKTTQGTQIVAAVNAKKNEIVALYALSDIKKDKKPLQNCADCTFFLGELKGAYEQLGLSLSPKEGATLKVFTEQEVFAVKTQFPEKGFQAKKEVVLGTTKATVIENKKGELILKTKNNEK